MDIVARLKLSGQNFSAELGRTLGDAERKFGNTGSVIGRNLSEGIGGGLQSAASRVPALGGALAGVSGSALIAAAGLGAVTLAAAHGLAGIEEYEGGVRQLDAVLKATGNNTGLVRDELMAIANDMEGVWVTPAEEIMKAEQVLASFEGVAGRVFERSLAGAADMSAVFGGDLTSNVEKVGTVMQNLAQGEVKGLEKGFKFLGAETLNSIKHLAEIGETAKAQEALLSALEARIGGSKEAEGKGLSGAYFRLGESVNGLIENLVRSTGAYESSIEWIDQLTDKVNGLGDAFANTESRGEAWSNIARLLASGAPNGQGGGLFSTEPLAPSAPKASRQKLTDDPYGLNRIPGLSLGDVVSRAAAAQSYQSAEAQRRAESAREAAATAAKKAQADRQREAKQSALELERSLASLREEYGSLAGATWKYAEALSEIERLQKAGKIGGPEVERLRLNVLSAGMDPNGKLAGSVQAQLGKPDLTARAAEAQGVTDAQKASVREVAEYWKEVNKAAIEDVADIMTDLIGGRAGRLIGDLFSLAGGGRANNPALALLTKSGGLFGSGTAGSETAGIAAVSGSVDKLDKGMRGIFGVSGEFTQSLGRMLAGASVGASAGGIVGGNSKASQFGAMAGGALGEKAGDMMGKTFGKQLGQLAGFAGPLGSIAGGVLGSVVGGLMTKVKWGASTISFSNGQLSAGAAQGNSSGAKKAAEAGAGKVVTSLEGILEALGGKLLSAPNVTIGTRHDDWRVNTTGTSLKIKKGAVEFDDDQQGAIEYAIQQMLAGSVIEGISKASERILKDTTKDLDKKIEQAGLIEAIPKSLRARLDPVGAAIDDLNKKWERTVAALREGGASAEQMAEAQKLYNMELADVKQNTAAASATLRDFLKSLGMGSSSPLSLRDQEAAAKVALQPFLDKIDMGTSIDQSAFQTVAQNFLDIERQLYGSTGQFFAAFEQIRAATSKAISTVDNAVPISSSPPSDPFAEKTASATQASADLLSQMSGQMATQQATLEAIRQALAGGGGFPFIGSVRNF